MVNEANSVNFFIGNNPYTPLYKTWWFGSHGEGEPGALGHLLETCGDETLHDLDASLLLFRKPHVPLPFIEGAGHAALRIPPAVLFGIAGHTLKRVEGPVFAAVLEGTGGKHLARCPVEYPELGYIALRELFGFDYLF